MRNYQLASKKNPATNRIVAFFKHHAYALKLAWGVYRAYTMQPQQRVLSHLQSKTFSPCVGHSDNSSTVTAFHKSYMDLLASEKVRMAKLGVNFDDVYEVGSDYQLKRKQDEQPVATTKTPDDNFQSEGNERTFNHEHLGTIRSTDS